MRKRRWLYLVAALLAAAATLLTFVVVRAFTTGFPWNATRVTAPGPATVALAEAGTYTISYEHQAAGEYSFGTQVSSEPPNLPSEINGLQMAIHSADSGDEVPLQVLGDTFTYQSGSTEGLGLAEFTIDRPGTYVLDSRFPSDGAGGPVTLAVARGGHGDVIAYVLEGFAAIVLFLGASVVGAIALILTLRAAHRARVTRRRVVAATSGSNHPTGSER